MTQASKQVEEQTAEMQKGGYMGPSDYNPIEHVKELRAQYKDLEKALEELKAGVGQSKAGRYAALALTETESARHWLGEVLGALDVESPYKA